MGKRPSLMHYGTPIRCRVYPEVATALIAEAVRTRRKVDFVAATILTWWHEDMLAEAKRKAEAGAEAE